MILQTQRLMLREMDQGDWELLCAILQDPEVMYAYEHAFSDQEVPLLQEGFFLFLDNLQGVRPLEFLRQGR